MPNVFDTNDIRTTGFTVEGRAVFSGNSTTPIVTVTGESGTNFTVIDDSSSTLLWGLSGLTGAVMEVHTDRIDLYEGLNVSGDTTVEGNFSATQKSFDIPHPIREGYRLRYGSLEGPENGVYFRGRTTSSVIPIPQYWINLVDENTITVTLTPIGKNFHWVENIENNMVSIDSESGNINCYYNIYGERKDIPPLLVEYKPL